MAYAVNPPDGDAPPYDLELCWGMSSGSSIKGWSSDSSGEPPLAWSSIYFLISIAIISLLNFGIEEYSTYLIALSILLVIFFFRICISLLRYSFDCKLTFLSSNYFSSFSFFFFIFFSFLAANSAWCFSRANAYSAILNSRLLGALLSFELFLLLNIISFCSASFLCFSASFSILA